MKKEWLSHKERLERRKKIADLVKGGAPIEYAAKVFGVSTNTVRNSCKNNGVYLPRKANIHHATKVSSFQMLMELLKGKTLQAIADELGVTRQRVGQIRMAASMAGFAFPDNRLGKWIRKKVEETTCPPEPDVVEKERAEGDITSPGPRFELSTAKQESISEAII